MQTETKGIVLRQYKMPGGRRMILLFSDKFGKISAGTNISENRKGKSALILRPFTYGKYELNKTRESYFINAGEVIKSHYRIGEDIDKYMQASYAMELTSRILPEEAVAPEIFFLLCDFLDLIEKRKGKYDTLTIAFMVKLLCCTGSNPVMDKCMLCGKGDGVKGFHIDEGGVICSDCISSENHKDILIFPDGFDIVNVLKYLINNPLQSLEKLALDDTLASLLKEMLRKWLACHLDIENLKSEVFI